MSSSMNDQLAAEVQAVQLLLDDWNLPELKESFAREEFTLRTLDCLMDENDKDLNIVIPKIGQRIVFWNCLKKWKESRNDINEPMNQTPNSGLIVRPASVLTQTVSSSHEEIEASACDVIVKTVEKSKSVSRLSNEGDMKQDSEYKKYMDLNFWFAQDPLTAAEIKKYYEEHHELDRKHRALLVALIITPIFKQRHVIPIRREIYKPLAIQIQERFPGEKMEDYAGSSTITGKFKNKFKHLSRTERLQNSQKPSCKQALNLPHETKNTDISAQHSMLKVPATSTTNDDQWVPQKNHFHKNVVPQKNHFHKNVTLVELLVHDPEKSTAIEECFYEKGRIDSKHRSLLVCLIIKLLYDSIEDQDKRHTIFNSLSEQIANHYPGEQKKIYFKKLLKRYNSVKSNRKQAIMKGLWKHFS